MGIQNSWLIDPETMTRRACEGAAWIEKCRFTVAETEIYLELEPAVHKAQALRQIGIRRRLLRESTVLTLGQNRGVQPFAQLGRQLIKFVRAIDLDGLACCVQRDDTVFAPSKMLFEVCPQCDRGAFINIVIELC